MGSLNSPDLALDLHLFAAGAAAPLLRDLPPPTTTTTARSARLHDLIRNLREERAKIEAFKRELPISARLVAHVIEMMVSEAEKCDSEIVEEGAAVKTEKDHILDNKMNWMSSAQLWSDNCSNESNHATKKTTQEKDENLSVESESWSGSGGAFVPFKCLPVAAARKEEKVAAVMPDLTLLSGGVKTSITGGEERDCRGDRVRAQLSTPVASPLSMHIQHTSQQQQQQQQQMPRKARRCWSPELHRRFVKSLEQLGGPQVATPKQIRELMMVDGLTNDEVKSHLQKFRLHSRRAPNSGQVNRSVALIGGLWAPQDHYPASSQQSASQSGSPEGPLQLAASARTISVTVGDSCEEDGKSESYSWK